MKEIKKCKWCGKEMTKHRSDAIFCRRACKNIHRRAEKNKKIKNENL